MLKLKRSRKSHRSTIIVVIIVALSLAVLTFILLETQGVTNMLKNRASRETPPPATSSSELPSAQSDFDQGGNNKNPGNTLNEKQGQATLRDNEGRITSETNNPITSATGEITVYSPTLGASIKSGQEISGTTTLDSIEYRIIDNVVGVIASGTLRVVNQRFSGTLAFSTTAIEGRIDIFAVKPDRTEYSNVEIPVKFYE